MREILFRGKDICSGELVFGYYLKSISKDGNERHHIIQTDGLSIDVDPETVGQFTGLADKNCAKVFEHDIVEYDGGRYGKWKPKQVVYGNTIDKALSACCGFMLDGTQMFLATNDTKDVKVIGNIHDNPELLEAKE